ncbi:18_t:CDS:2 [Dentiscutata erythropus]|uniref:18_t:CDS:1 n=1 Tax=Dentiscutata erythropus TaxID=1348616 RepID=A0A9N9APQ8_9GLOM|nr:18_t:CDS:2 [Dentiscutata erythropus]
MWINGEGRLHSGIVRSRVRSGLQVLEFFGLINPEVEASGYTDSY